MIAGPPIKRLVGISSRCPVCHVKAERVAPLTTKVNDNKEVRICDTKNCQIMTFFTGRVIQP